MSEKTEEKWGRELQIGKREKGLAVGRETLGSTLKLNTRVHKQR